MIETIFNLRLEIYNKETLVQAIYLSYPYSELRCKVKVAPRQFFSNNSKVAILKSCILFELYWNLLGTPRLNLRVTTWPNPQILVEMQTFCFSISKFLIQSLIQTEHIFYFCKNCKSFSIFANELHYRYLTRSWICLWICFSAGHLLFGENNCFSWEKTVASENMPMSWK